MILRPAVGNVGDGRNRGRERPAEAGRPQRRLSWLLRDGPELVAVAVNIQDLLAVPQLHAHDNLVMEKVVHLPEDVGGDVQQRQRHQADEDREEHVAVVLCVAIPRIDAEPTPSGGGGGRDGHGVGDEGQGAELPRAEDEAMRDFRAGTLAVLDDECEDDDAVGEHDGAHEHRATKQDRHGLMRLRHDPTHGLAQVLHLRIEVLESQVREEMEGHHSGGERRDLRHDGPGKAQQHQRPGHDGGEERDDGGRGQEVAATLDEAVISIQALHGQRRLAADKHDLEVPDGGQPSVLAGSEHADGELQVVVDVRHLRPPANPRRMLLNCLVAVHHLELHAALRAVGAEGHEVRRLGDRLDAAAAHEALAVRTSRPRGTLAEGLVRELDINRPILLAHTRDDEWHVAHVLVVLARDNGQCAEG
mmetsp:Transcript_86287/g.249015  ORF Transcript_86287/g.249015 Transcript_86287/m.249015 type:complete len:418 (-) Transcript_86287:705-1958(-)